MFFLTSSLIQKVIQTSYTGLFVGLFLVLPCSALATDTYRGVNVDASLVIRQDIEDLTSLGVNIVRVSFNNFPMIDKTPPYLINSMAIAKLDLILTWCEAAKLRVIIDPHTFPGTALNVTTMSDDALWSDSSFHERIITFWGMIAQRYKNRGSVIFGYDLMNEPYVPRLAIWRGPADWNNLVEELVKKIRTHDNIRYLIIEPAAKNKFLSGEFVNNIEGIESLQLPVDDRIMVSPHMYLPLKFTHQGVFDYFNKAYAYPGEINGVVWNKEALRKALDPIIRFQKINKVPIFIGEFSAVRWLGESGNRYLNDLIDIFEENRWSWAYHTFRAAGVWDAEMSNDDQNSTMRHPVTPRMTMLKKYFSKNKSEP